MRVRPQDGHCSSLRQTDFSSQPIITALQATYVGPLPIQYVHSVVTSQTQLTLAYRCLKLSQRTTGQTAVKGT